MSTLVFNSLSLPFSTLPNSRLKPGIMEQGGRILGHISAARNLAVYIFLSCSVGLRKNRFETDSRTIDFDHVSAGK